METQSYLNVGKHSNMQRPQWSNAKQYRVNIDIDICYLYLELLYQETDSQRK